MVQDTEAASPASNAAAVVTSSLDLRILDSTHYPSPPKTHKLTISSDTTGQAFREKIAEELGYTMDSIDVKQGSVSVEADEERTLVQLGFNTKALVTVSRRNGKEEDFKSKRTPDVQVSVPSSSSTALITYGPQNFNNSYSSSSSSSSSSSYTSNWNYNRNTRPAGRSSTGFVGLSNQGATCYMNSLIQTLYMTPEFRAAVYKWSFEEKLKQDKEKEKEKASKAENGTPAPTPATPSPAAAPLTAEEERLNKEKFSIPLQLQRLFARLQLCDVVAAKTKDLTKSFRWEDSDAFTQHDVQELCRVLFDALEKSFQGTEQANLVNELYQGKMKDYVQCKECGSESARPDPYLDIPLVIKGFGETKAVESVEEALRKFVQPEILDGDNQYSCEKCNKKVDAVKGLKFVSFPYLLTLQLKRFDFDYNTMRRVKLNDKVVFPHYLDLNSFIDSTPTANGNGEAQPTTQSDPSEASSSTSDDVIEATDDDHHTGNGKHSDDVLIGKRQKRAGEMRDEFLDDFEGPPPVPTPERPHVYELYSVLIHRGSTMGGHYYAYIKSFETNKWFEFNDSSVTEINVRDIKKAFGGDEEGTGMGYTSSYSSMYKSTFRSTSNAYMLMYRRIESSRNIVNVPDKDVPVTARDVIDGETQQIKTKREQEEKEKEMLKMKVHYPAAVVNTSKDPPSKEINVHKSETLEEATRQAAEAFGEGERFKKHGFACVRLRSYTAHSDLPGETYTGGEGKTMEELRLFSYNSYNYKNMMLEIREPDAMDDFVDYQPNDVLFRVHKFDPATNSYASPVNIYVNRSLDYLSVKQAIEKRLGIPVDELRVYKENTYANYHVMLSSSSKSTVEEVTVSDEYPLRGNKISEPERYYVEHINPDVPAAESPARKELERIKNLFEIKFNIPGKEGKEAEGTIVVDKNISLKEFRAKLAPLVGLAVEEFKIKRGQVPYQYELQNETETVGEQVPDTITIEKGKPTKEGETVYSIFMFEPEKESDNITELFEFTMDENLMVHDAKKMIADRLREELIKRNEREKKSAGKAPPVNAPANDSPNNVEPTNTEESTPTSSHTPTDATPTSETTSSLTTSDSVPPINPDYLRFRDITWSIATKKLGKALPNDRTLKSSLTYSKRIVVQLLPEPETIKDTEVAFFIQHFKPSTYELTKKEDYKAPENMSIEDFKEAMGKHFNIPTENVSVVRVDTFYSYYDDPETLEIPKLGWDKTIVYLKNTISDALNVRHGSLVLVRDKTEPLKELTKQEQDAIEKEYKKKVAKNLMSGTSYGYGYSSFNRKEKALKIQTE